MSASDLGERIGKRLARAGVASRREAAGMVVDGRVAVDGTVVTNPAVKVGPESRVTVDGVLLGEPAPSRFVAIPQTQRNARSIRRTTTAGVAAGNPIGGLGLYSEGLLLLTNDGDLAQTLQERATGWRRQYQ